MRTCANPGCGKQHRASRPNGWCHGCYQRWLAHDRPPEGPPEPQPGKQHGPSSRRDAAVRDATRRAFEARLEAYRALAGMPDRKAAREMGVTTRTIERYRQVLGIYSAGRAEFPRRLEEFRRMHAEGVPVLQIAARLHVARRTVWGYRARGRREGWL